MSVLLTILPSNKHVNQVLLEEISMENRFTFANIILPIIDEENSSEVFEKTLKGIKESVNMLKKSADIPVGITKIFSKEKYKFTLYTFLYLCDL